MNHRQPEQPNNVQFPAEPEPEYTLEEIMAEFGAPQEPAPESVPEPASEPVSEPAPEQAPEPIPEPEPDCSDEGQPKTKRRPDGSWKCMFCDHMNPSGKDYCQKCGAEAFFDQP